MPHATVVRLLELLGDGAGGDPRGRRRPHPARAGAGEGRAPRGRPLDCGRCSPGSSGSSRTRDRVRRRGPARGPARAAPGSRRRRAAAPPQQAAPPPPPEEPRPAACDRQPARPVRSRRPRRCRPARPSRVRPASVADPAPVARTRRAADSVASTLESMRSLWPAVIDLVRAENALLGALIADARPVELDGEELTFAFALDAFLKKKAEDPANRVIVGEALRAVTGGRWRLLYELREELAEDDRRRSCRGRVRGARGWHASWRSSTPRRFPPAPRTPRRSPARRACRRRRGRHEQRERRLMPKQPRHAERAADDEAGPEDAGGHGGRAGGARRARSSRRPPAAAWSPCKMTGDLQVREVERSTPRRSTPRTSRCSPTWCWRPSTRRCAWPRSSPRASMGGATAGLDLGGLGGLGLPGL